MVLKELVSASLGCYHFRAYHASFLLALCAADATAKKRFPSESSVGRRFKDFLRVCMPQLCGVQNYWVAVEMPEDRSALSLDSNGMADLPNVDDDFYRLSGQPRRVLMQGVLYHAFRCTLSHEANLSDVELLPPNPNNALAVTVDTKVRISANIIGRLLHVIVNAPENEAIFGVPKQTSAPAAGSDTVPQQRLQTAH